MSVFEDAVAQEDLTHIYALFSGGHDSLVSTALAAQHPLFAGVVHINTGIGIEETRQFVRDTCERQRWSLHEVHAPEGRYAELVLTRGGFPYGSASHNTMLFYLKQQPLLRWHRRIEGRHGFVTGIRKDESVRRMGAGISVPIRRDSKNTRMTWISPILDWTKLDCNEFIERKGLQRNRVVDLLHRSGECLCGALARSEEIHDIAAWFPDTARQINALEAECEKRGIVASVWASRQARDLDAGQTALFAKSELAPLCTSCEAR
jgi:3'-phosphoadenosine 5'-phosphosulfate sulfotransferase (PAPS reductase)/FAD synthetase